MHSRPARRATRLRLLQRLLAAAALFGASAAASAQFTVELAAGPANGRVECVASSPCDRGRFGWKLGLGYRLDDAIELQASYFGAHRFKGGGTAPAGSEFGGAFDVNGLGFTGGYRWVFAPEWSLTGRAGAAAVRAGFDYAQAGIDSRHKTTVQPLAGAGLAWQVTPAVAIGLDADLTRFEAHDHHGSLRQFGAALQFSF